MKSVKEASENKKEEADNKGITVKKGEDFSEWYTQVVQKVELVDYAPVQGFMGMARDGMGFR